MMFRISKITAIVSTLIISGIVSLLFFIKIANTSLPPDFLEKSVININDTVQVYTNHYGIHHVVARNKSDAFFMVGYLQARDRLWQMDYLRRLASGTLSEVIGSETLNIDKFMRLINLKGISRKLYNAADNNSKQIIQAYCDGVNFYINQNKTRLPIEFNALNYIPEKWEPSDCYLAGRLMAFQLSKGFVNDLFFAQVAERLGNTKAMELIPAYPTNSPHILDDTAKAISPKNLKDSNNIKKIAYNSYLFEEIKKLIPDALKFLGWNSQSTGSNTWVAKKLKDGKSGVILANDPHLAVTMPALWYQMHVTFPGYNTSGLMIPGEPVFIAGRNDYISWGITNLMVDDCDFFIEKNDSSNSNFYYLPSGKKEKYRFIRDTIRIKNSLQYNYYKKATNISVVISEAYKQKFNNQNKNNFFDKYSLTFSWTGSFVSNDINSLYKINTSKDWFSFTKAVSDWGAPAMCFSYSDIYGNFGLIPAGFSPIRKQTNPNLLNPSYIEGYHWEGYNQISNYGKLFNPPCNYAVAANNQLSRNFALNLTNYWEPPSRASRIGELLKQHDEYSAREAQIMQSDVLSPYAKEFLSMVIPIMDELKKNFTDREKLALSYLKKWDFILSPMSVGASIYSEFLNKLIYHTFYDELGPNLIKEYMSNTSLSSMKILELLKDPAFPVWFDDVTTSQTEYKNFILLKSYREALKSLEKMTDENDISKWNYGKIHTIMFNHFLSRESLISAGLNIGPFQIGGNNTTINNTSYSPLTSYNTLNYASMRIVTDMDENMIYTCLPGGNSGDPQSPNYKDQVQLWMNGGYVPVSTSRQPSSNFKESILFYPAKK